MSVTPLPKLYAILDGAAVQAAGFYLLHAAQSLRDAGIQLMQYRDKNASKSEILENAIAIRSVFDGWNTTLVLNDWPEIVVEARWDGVHVGQKDTSVYEARRVVGCERLVGVSTHSLEQYRSALRTDADYIAYGPIFGTTTKQDAEPPVGVHGLLEVRKLRDRPLVAIGGISLGQMDSVFAAGADSVAVIGELYRQEQPIQNVASDLLRRAEQFRLK